MKEERIRILYLDDEANNLNAFRASFRRDYEIYTALTVSEARHVLQEHAVHVVIADQRMPGMTGVEFLDSIKDEYSAPVRILLTGYTDFEALVNAINKGQIFRYIKKPWDEIELKNAIGNAHELYMARKELREKMEELEKTNSELNRFIYSISHDLRSPLMSVLGIVNLARMEHALVDANGYFDMIETSITRLDGFIQKMIEYYKNSRLESEWEEIDFQALIRETVETFGHQDPQMIFDVEVNQDTVFAGDAFRITVVLNNLISNAVKYRKPQEAQPRVKITANVYPGYASLVIEDNGIGILSDHLDHIFDMFFRTRNNNQPGTGIGLYIVKEALSHIGGNIAVSSVYGEGAKFELTIPNHSAA